MQLAKAEGGGVLAEAPQDLAVPLAHVVADLQRTALVPIEASLPAPGSVFSLIDADAFAILARNLIENACKHGAQDHAVEVSLSTSARPPAYTPRNVGPFRIALRSSSPPTREEREARAPQARAEDHRKHGR